MEPDSRARNVAGGAVVAALTTGTAAVVLAVIAAFSGRFEAAAVGDRGR